MDKSIAVVGNVVAIVVAVVAVVVAIMLSHEYLCSAAASYRTHSQYYSPR